MNNSEIILKYIALIILGIIFLSMGNDVYTLKKTEKSRAIGILITIVGFSIIIFSLILCYYKINN